MKITAQQLADILEGTVVGDANAAVSSPARIEDAQKGQLSFIANPKYEHHIYSTNASIVIVGNELKLTKAVNTTLIRVADPYSAFSKLLEIYQQQVHAKQGKEDPHFIAEGVEVAEDVYVGAFVYIGAGAKVGKGSKIYPQVYLGENVVIGENVTIYPGTKIYHNCQIGANCIIHAGVVIGSDGFGFAPQEDGTFKKIPQTGNVIIEENVEIGGNTTIDRATIGSTIIRKGVKIDNLVQIAHNVEIGENTVVAAQAGISGSTKLGKNIMVGGQAGFVGHISIADNVKVNAQSGVSKSIKDKGAAVTGSPAYDYTEALRSQVVTKRLPDLEKRINELEKQLRNIKETSE